MKENTLRKPDLAAVNRLKQLNCDLLKTPGNFSLHLEKAAVLIELQRYREAETSVRFYLTKFSENKEALKVLRQISDHQALQQRNVESRTAVANAHMLVDEAIGYIESGQHKLAAPCIEQADKLDVSVEDLEFVRALYYLEEKEVDLARRALLKELARFPDNNKAYQFFNERISPRTDQQGGKEPLIIFPIIPLTGSEQISHAMLKQYDLLLTHQFVDRALAHDCLREIGKSQLRHLKFIYGQGLFYGVHKFFDCDYRYISFIRDPLDYVVSSYHSHLSNPLSSWNKEICKLGMTLEEYAKKASNFQLSYFLGHSRGPGSSLTQSDLEKAKQIVEQDFALVGVYSRHSESMAIVGEKLSLPREFCESVVQPKAEKSYLAELPALVVERISKINQLEIEFFNFCNSLLKVAK